MTILVTRPSPAGEILVSALRARGQNAISAPLIRIQPGDDLPLLTTKMAALSPGDALFLLSKNAVYHANKQLIQQNYLWSDKFCYYGIGQSTAQYFQTLTGLSAAFMSGGETSEHLLTHPDLQTLTGRRILLLRGNGGREHLAQTLRERSADVNYCECYRREPVEYDGGEYALRWQKQQVNTLVVTSGEMLQLLRQLIPPAHLSWLFQCRIVVVSDRLATIAHSLGWQHIIIARSADNEALLQALQ
ncbi:MAG TPA: uroporphyrinogen-III synthase [Morganella sp. (in: Bacteria)]|nr:uroporphyrinogen-III synthase [Morganella sp. (in: enterobacteria)]